VLSTRTFAAEQAVVLAPAVGASPALRLPQGLNEQITNYKSCDICLAYSVEALSKLRMKKYTSGWKYPLPLVSLNARGVIVRKAWNECLLLGTIYLGKYR
jgi:hypothetical protein